MSMRLAIFVVLFWIIAAACVTAAHRALDPHSFAAASAATIAAVVVAAYGYTHLCAPHAGISHALGVGIAWLVLAIAIEIAMTTHLGHGWYALVGSPDRPLMRNISFFVWIFSPALFAQFKDER